MRIYAGHFLTTIHEIEVEGVKHRVIPRDFQLDAVRDLPLHVDFMRLGSHARVTVTVPVVFTNPEMSPGIRRGGILNIVRHGVELNCPVDRIPDHLVVELNGLEIGDSLHISRVNMPEGCRPTITARTTEREFAAACAEVGRFDRGHITLVRLATPSPWEKHPDGDELLYIVRGAIDVELAGRPGDGAGEGARGFVGIAFRVRADHSAFECFYLRPTNGRAGSMPRVPR